MSQKPLFAEPTVVEAVALSFVEMYGFPKALEEAERIGRTAKEFGRLAGYYLMQEVIDHLLAIRGRSVH